MPAIPMSIRFACLALVALLAAGQPTAAQAQAIVATINDSPVTTFDLDQRMRMLRAMRANASREAALESLVEDRIKASEIRKYGIQPSNQDAMSELTRIANERKMSVQTLGAALQSAGVDPSHWQEHGKAQIGWRGYVSALNRSVGVSENEVRAELAKRGSKNDEYRLRPIVFIVPRDAGSAVADARAREASNLRTRFADCESGLQFAAALKDVAIRPPITRSVATLPDQIVAILEKTPVGRLTPPSRSADGFEMFAVCGKGSGGTDSTAAQEVRQELLARKLQSVSQKLYAPLRSRAIIVQR